MADSGGDPDQWFEEPGSPYFSHRYKIKDRVFQKKTKFQTLEILDSIEFGRMLILDGCVQLTEADEFIYHEMLVHIPLLTHPHPKDVHIIGGGDGGTLREVLKHAAEKVMLTELDEEVVKASWKHLGSVSRNSFSDSRVSLNFAEGSETLSKFHQEWDIILVDSTDPIGEAAKLFTEEFYCAAFEALKEDGIIVTQSGSPVFQAKVLNLAYSGIKTIFPVVKVYTAFVPTYPGVFWSFTLGSKQRDPTKVELSEIKERLKALNLETKYYNLEIHQACFALPEFVKKILSGDLPNGILRH